MEPTKNLTTREKYARYKLSSLSTSLIEFWAEHYGKLPYNEKLHWINYFKSKSE